MPSKPETMFCSSVYDSTPITILAHSLTVVALCTCVGLMARLHRKRHLFPIVNGLDASNLLGSNAELVIDGEDWKFTWNAGVLARPIPKLTLGATVIGRVDPMLEGEVNLTTGEVLDSGTIMGP